MSVARIGKPRADDETVTLLREIRDLLRDMLATQQRKQSPAAVPALVSALEEHYGPARFTVRSVLDVVAEDPHGALAEAVAQVVDMNASLRSRVTALGALLSRLPELEVVAEQRQRAASRYKLVI